MQPGEGDVHLRLDAERAEDTHVTCPRDRPLHQGALSDPGLPAKNECGASPAPGRVERLVDPLGLALAAEEHLVSERTPTAGAL